MKPRTMSGVFYFIAFCVINFTDGKLLMILQGYTTQK